MSRPRRSAAPTARLLLRREPVAYAVAWLSWVAFFTLPLPAGLVLKAVLDRVAEGPATPVGGLLVALAAIELGRWLVFAFAVVQWHGCWVFWNTLPRVNMLRSLVAAPGPTAGRLPSSPGEAVSRFRDDAMHLSMVLDVWLDMSGATVSALAAVAVMTAVDARVTLVVVIPVVLALLLCRQLGNRLRMWRRREREATAAVTGFIGDVFGAIGAVKVAGAEHAVAARFHRLGEARADAARVDQVATQVLRASSSAIGNLGTGLVVLLVVPTLAAGDATVGDVALFASAVGVLATLPRWAASLGAQHRQAEVSVERMARLMPDRASEGVVAPAPTHLRHGPGPFPAVVVGRPSARAGADRLDLVTVRGLTVAFPGGAPAVAGVDLEVPRGSLTVVTGPVGSGKSTLLRGLLGLVPVTDGEIRWNGMPVPDPSRLLVPPRAAYVAQVPRLFSEPLADAILLGVAAGGLDEAVRLACLDEDVAWMPEGLATVVGAKGVRLSGGQIQRTAAARAFVRRPELLVIDDLSSALDVETEARMWRQLLEGGSATTLLVVSHRPAVLARADQVVVLEAGRRVA
ncbi:MAG: ATP-binding cassette domain-containing protein [Acidimicrobiales bacterium]